MTTALKYVNRKAPGQKRACNTRHDRWLGILQYTLDKLLDCKTAFGGSTALYVHGEVDTYGDIDVVTDRMFTANELEEIFGYAPNNESKQGFQFWNSLDIFFVNRPDNQRILKLANQHIVEVEGIRIQTSQFVKEVNWYWQGKKERLVAEPTIPGLREAL